MSDSKIVDHLPWKWWVINSSGGKDSQTALRQMVHLADEVGFPRGHLVVSHQDLGEMEWPGTRELAEEQARHYGLRFEVSKYRNRHGEELTLLDYVRQRGKWPDSKNRFCTSEFKRGPGGRVLTMLSRERPGPILNVYGFRAEESANRAKKKEFVHNKRFSAGKREVWDFLPIHHWAELEVWGDIRESGVRHHWAYDLGMPRLSCTFCIFAPRAALMIAGKARPDLLAKYCELEEEIGHTFQHKKPLTDIKRAIEEGEEIDKSQLHGTWNM